MHLDRWGLRAHRAASLAATLLLVASGCVLDIPDSDQSGFWPCTSGEQCTSGYTCACPAGAASCGQRYCMAEGGDWLLPGGDAVGVQCEVHADCGADWLCLGKQCYPGCVEDQQCTGAIALGDGGLALDCVTNACHCVLDLERAAPTAGRGLCRPSCMTLADPYGCAALTGSGAFCWSVLGQDGAAGDPVCTRPRCASDCSLQGGHCAVESNNSSTGCASGCLFDADCGITAGSNGVACATAAACACVHDMDQAGGPGNCRLRCSGLQVCQDSFEPDQACEEKPLVSGEGVQTVCVPRCTAHADCEQAEALCIDQTCVVGCTQTDQCHGWITVAVEGSLTATIDCTGSYCHCLLDLTSKATADLGSGTERGVCRPGCDAGGDPYAQCSTLPGSYCQAMPRFLDGQYEQACAALFCQACPGGHCLVTGTAGVFGTTCTSGCLFDADCQGYVLPGAQSGWQCDDQEGHYCACVELSTGSVADNQCRLMCQTPGAPCTDYPSGWTCEADTDVQGMGTATCQRSGPLATLTVEVDQLGCGDLANRVRVTIDGASQAPCQQALCRYEGSSGQSIILTPLEVANCRFSGRVSNHLANYWGGAPTAAVTFTLADGQSDKFFFEDFSDPSLWLRQYRHATYPIATFAAAGSAPTGADRVVMVGAIDAGTRLDLGVLIASKDDGALTMQARTLVDNYLYNALYGVHASSSGYTAVGVTSAGAFDLSQLPTDGKGLIVTGDLAGTGRSLWSLQHVRPPYPTLTVLRDLAPRPGHPGQFVVAGVTGPAYVRSPLLAVADGDSDLVSLYRYDASSDTLAEIYALATNDAASEYYLAGSVPLGLGEADELFVLRLSSTFSVQGAWRYANGPMVARDLVFRTVAAPRLLATGMAVYPAEPNALLAILYPDGLIDALHGYKNNGGSQPSGGNVMAWSQADGDHVLIAGWLQAPGHDRDALLMRVSLGTGDPVWALALDLGAYEEATGIASTDATFRYFVISGTAIDGAESYTWALRVDAQTGRAALSCDDPRVPCDLARLSSPALERYPVTGSQNALSYSRTAISSGEYTLEALASTNYSTGIESAITCR